MRYTYALHGNESGLDLDSRKAFMLFLTRLWKILPLVSKIIIIATRPGHYHVYIKLKKRHRFIDISALQVYLGSDLKRELAGLSRLWAGATMPFILIEYTKVPYFLPAIICACPRVLNGRKFANCPHLLGFRRHAPKFGFLSTRLRILGVKDPFGHS